MDFPIKNCDFPWQNVSLPEGNVGETIGKQYGKLYGKLYVEHVGNVQCHKPAIYLGMVYIYHINFW